MTQLADAPLVVVDHVSKKFARRLRQTLWYGLQDIASMALGRAARPLGLRDGEFLAVDDVCFSLRRGETLGVIGPNGAGKSSMLKLMTGLLRPDAGQIDVRGRVGSMIELGTGFNPILTGRENVYLNGAILGLSRADIASRFDAIVDFAEVGEFIDTPLRAYSSGMKVRLGFAVASELRPDLLLIDEVLAVGDVGFRAKSYNRLAQMREQAAVILVSHNMTQITRLADRVMVLDHGKVVFLGEPAPAVAAYQRLFLRHADEERGGDGCARIEHLVLSQAGREVDEQLDFAAPVSIRLHVRALASVDPLVVDLVFIGASGEQVAQCNNYVSAQPLRLDASTDYIIEADIGALALNPGRYRVAALLMSGDMATHHDWWPQARVIEVCGPRRATAGHQMVARWRCDRV
ncbi:MAG: ABC transporter ATP-binding protein [Myxococcota bacterium]